MIPPNTPRNPATLVLLAVAGLVAVAAWFAGRATSVPPVMSEPEAENALGRQLSRIESRLDRLESASPRGANSLPVPAAPGYESPALIEARSQHAMAESEAVAQKLRAALDARFSSSPPPGQAEIRASQHLLHAMEDEALLAAASPPVAQDIRCRGGLCRMEFFFADAAAADDWMTFYPPLTGQHISRTQHFVERGADGATRVIAYGHRP
ncbi:hypothetical protein [Lysobacter sp. A3-1-A15]|uniref:hypothetical protein n=1 Tax=Novilysobacter viscosus TaxID=3098602 RepID=UPI002ED9B525